MSSAPFFLGAIAPSSVVKAEAFWLKPSLNPGLKFGATNLSRGLPIKVFA